MYDVIVAGAGPAGNMAALRLSEMGRKVLVVDWRRDIGDKLCTGIIGKECVERYPPRDCYIYHQARSATVVSPNGKRYTVSREHPQAYVVDRAAYVRSFADFAIEAGAEYMLGPRVSSVEISDRAVQVTTSYDSVQQSFQAEMLVIASGFGSPLLRMAGLQNGRNQEFMIGCQAVVEANDLRHTEVYLGERIASGSFGWLVPISETRALAGLLLRQRPNDEMECFLSALREQGKVAEKIKEPQQWGIPLKPTPKTYDNRVLAVGDAAGLVKPTTGGGIYYALRSGELAAETIDSAFEKGDLSRRQLRQYERGWKSILGRELRIGYYARAVYEALDDRQIESLLGEFFSENVQEELINSPDFSFDWHSRVVLKAINYRSLRTALSSFGPIVSTLIKRLR